MMAAMPSSLLRHLAATTGDDSWPEPVVLLDTLLSAGSLNDGSTVYFFYNSTIYLIHDDV